MSELKPCAHCGSKAGMLLHKPDDGKDVYCTNNKCFMADVYATVEQWNNRAPSQAEAEMREACTCKAEVVKTCGNCGGAGWYTIPTGANGEITEQCQCDECFGQPEQAKEIESLPKGWPEIGGAVIEMRLKIEELITVVNEMRRMANNG